MHPPSSLSMKVRWLPGAWQRRFHGLLAVGLYVPSLASLTIFLSSLENAHTVTDRIFFSGVLTLCSYVLVELEASIMSPWVFNTCMNG